MDGKNFLKSKTLWFNVLALLVLVAEGFGYTDFVADPQMAEYAAAIITLINVGLRLITKEPVKLTS